MKYIFIKAIKLYQIILSRLFKQVLGVNEFCRYRPTCSEYAIISLAKHGLIKGSSLSVRRILSCQPFFKFQL